MFYCYILYSKSSDKYYVGYTSNIHVRLSQHNSGETRSTKNGIPWEIVYLETFDSKSSAIKREKEIKKMKSRKYITKLIDKN